MRLPYKADEGVPMATDSILRLTSMSKVVAAVAVMQLFEQGRIALHAFSPHQTYFSGAGGLHGTTADYFRFAQMLLNGGELDGVRVLSPASVRL